MILCCVVTVVTVTWVNLLLLVVVRGCHCIIDRDSEDEGKGSKKPKRKAVGIKTLGNVDGDALSAATRDGGFMDRGSFGGGPSGRRPMGGCGPMETSTVECEVDAQGENSSGGQSGMQRKMDRGKFRERAPLEALLLPRTKRRKVDPLSSDVGGCRLVQQQMAASRTNRGNGKGGQGEQD